MSIAITDERDDPFPVGPLDHLAELVLRGEGVPSDAEVAITLVDIEEMTVLNEQYMGEAGPTDVLSFPLEHLTAGTPPVAEPNGPPVALGDVVICPAQVLVNAERNAVDVVDEMALMVVHGLLHLLGYDHVDDDDAQHMEGRERRYLELAGRRRA